MSDLSVLMHRLGSFLSNFTHSDPTVTTSVQSVGASMTTLAGQVEAILPHLADDAANAALALIPGGLGEMVAPEVDGMIDAVIAKLLAKKSTAVPPLQSPGITTGPSSGG